MKVSIGPFRKKKERKIKIHIDEYDTWSMDHTLALIALPMLKQLRDTTHGSAMVDLQDVPFEMRYTSHEEWDSQKSFDFYHEDKSEDMIHERWTWTLDEMIFAMESIVKDDDSEFYDNSKTDWEGLFNHHDRVDNGLRLFGKYFRGLWD